MECSDNKSLDKIERKRQKLRRAATASSGAKLVEAADQASTTRGYVQWCYAVCQHLSGENAALDAKLRALFTAHGITAVTDEDLETYYLVIDGSE